MAQKPQISLEGKVAFISGASKGIGIEIARVLAAAGADLALTARDETALEATAETARSEGADVWTTTADLNDADQVRELGERTLDAVGRVDILVNNAGLIFPASILDIKIDEWHATFDVDLLAPLLLTQAFAPGMIERKHGKIINISSRGGLQGQTGLGAYSAAKAALHLLTRIMAVEFGPHGIQANCLAPTVTMTDMAKAVWTPGPRTDAKLARIPAGRFAEPNEIADGVLFLASHLSDFVSGTILPVDGGEGAG